MHRLLERLDASASTLVPLLYLSGLMLGAAAYFAGITINAGLAVGIALASAAELHSFLQQRRVRANWAHLSRLTDTDIEHEHALRQFKVNVSILIGLLAFSSFNAIMFIAETWTPAPGPQGWRITQIVIRGLVIPVFFFLAGFLAPLHTDASDQMRVTSTEMLRRTLKAIDRQWRARLKRAEKRNADLAPVAISLLQEAGDHAAARRIELIARGLHATESGKSYTLTSDTATPSLDTPTKPALPAMPAAKASQNGNNGHNREARRAALEESMFGGFGGRAHPTSPRAHDYHIDGSDEDDAADWASSNSRHAEDFGEWGDDGPQIRMHQRSGRSERTQAAHIAPRGAELTVRESVMLDLPPSKYETEDNTDQQRAVFRVLDWADANDKSLSRDEVAARAGVSVNTVRTARPLWDLLRSQDKSRKRKASRKTREMPAVTPDMLTTTR